MKYSGKHILVIEDQKTQMIREESDAKNFYVFKIVFFCHSIHSWWRNFTGNIVKLLCGFVQELLYAIYVRCPTIQGVFRIPCAASKKQEFKTQLDAGNLPKDWLSADLPPNLLCDTLKDFLQHIPGGVFGIPTKVLMKSHSKGFLHFKE